MVMLGRALGVEPVKKPDLTKYGDAAQVAPYAQGMVAALIDAGIVGGVTSDTLAPQGEINRASTVTILDRAIGTYANTDGETVNVSESKGITLIVANNVTVTGKVDTLIVASSDNSVKLDGATVEKVSVTGEGSTVVLNNTEVKTVVASGTKAVVETTGTTKAETLTVTGTNASVTTADNTTVGTLIVSAENASVTTEGETKIESVSVSETAANTTITTGSGTTISKVENNAEGTTVTGSGTVETVESSKDVAVETKGTTVESTGDTEITVTDSTGKETTVDTGKSSTTKTADTTPVHYHSYDTSKWVVDDTYHWHAANCGHDLTIDKAEHTFGEGSICTVCDQLKSSGAVAQINGRNYADLAAAIAAAVDGDTVKLVKSVKITNTYTIANENPFTIDFNGYYIDATEIGPDYQSIVVKEDADVTFTGRGGINGKKNCIDNSGTVTINGGTYTTTLVGRGSALWNTMGTMTVNSCEVHAMKYALYNEKGKCTLNGGEFACGAHNKLKPYTNGYNGYGYAVVNEEGTLIINDGVTIEGIQGGLSTSGEGATFVNGGTIKTVEPEGTDSFYACYAADYGYIEINGGSFVAAKRSAVYVGNEDVGLDGARILIKGGVFTPGTNSDAVAIQANVAGDLDITGGTFGTDPSNYVAEGHAVYQNESGAYQVIKNEGEIEVTLSELKSVAVTKGPKAEGSETTVFTVNLGEQEIAAEDIAYSEVSSGYTGKGVLIGNTGLNSYGVRPANIGDYKFVITGGTINSAADGYSSIDGFANTSVYMLVPANSDVVFENVTFNGVFSFDVQKYTSPWSNLNSLTFKNCVFNGIIVGTCPASNVTFDGCKFNSYTNASSANNSNPIWWREDTEGSGENANPIKTFTFVNNEVVGTRPVKIERIGKTVSPVFTITNNTFDIISREVDTVTKNMAINIGMGENPNLPFTLIDDGNTISANTAALYTASLTSGSNQYKEVSGMKVQDANGNPKTITAMVWKTNTDETFELKSVD